MLTDLKCRSARPKDKPYRLPDGKGLYLEIRPNGAKAWRYRFKLRIGEEVRENMFAVGDFVSAPVGETPDQAATRRGGGMFTLAEAREERTRARALVKQGLNPAHSRRLIRVERSQQAANTFEVVAREWIAGKLWEWDTKAERLRMLERIVFPKIGPLPVRQVTPAHVLDVLRSAAKDNGPTVAASAKRTMSGVFGLAVATLRAEIDPVYPVRNALPANKTQHKRPLSPEEIGRLLRDLDGYERNFQTVAAFRLMWLTLCRPNEVVGARWNEIDLQSRLWTIPSERMKKRREHRVPLPVEAVALLQNLHGVTGHREHVFPNRDHRKKHMADATLRQALKQLGWAGNYSPHATRTTGATILNEMGYEPDWIERQLAHLDPNSVRRTYNHADYLADRSTMMQDWARYLDSLKAGGNVTPIRRAPAPEKREMAA